MGSSPSNPPPAEQPAKPPQPKPKKAHVHKAATLPMIEPTPPTISKIIEKQIHMPQSLNRHQEQMYQEVRDQLLQVFKTKFLAKASKKQLRIIFTNSTNTTEDNSSRVSQFSDRSIVKFERSCELDYLLYAEILEMRWKCVFAQQIKKAQKQNYIEQDYNNFRKLIEGIFIEVSNALLAEIQGKTTIWCSLNLSPAQKKNKIVNFLHQEGIDSAKFYFVAENSHYCQT